MTGDPSKCCCEENEKHIYKTIVKVKNWLVKPDGGEKWINIK